VGARIKERRKRLKREEEKNATATNVSEEKGTVPAGGQREWRVDVVHHATLQGTEHQVGGLIRGLGF
jgi:hypothetical protein